MLPSSCAHVKLAPRLTKHPAHVRHARLGLLRRDEALHPGVLLRREIAHLLGDLH